MTNNTKLLNLRSKRKKQDIVKEERLKYDQIFKNNGLLTKLNDLTPP